MENKAENPKYYLVYMKTPRYNFMTGEIERVDGYFISGCQVDGVKELFYGSYHDCWTVREIIFSHYTPN